MLKERKLKTQENFIKRLRDENRELRDRIRKLESEAASRKDLLESAKEYRNQHLRLLKHMDDAGKNYVRALVDKALLNLKEFCDYMGVGQTKARELLRGYNGFGVQIGNRWYANRKKLDVWIDKQSI